MLVYTYLYFPFDQEPPISRQEENDIEALSTFDEIDNEVESDEAEDSEPSENRVRFNSDYCL